MPEIIGGDATARFFSERGSRKIDEFRNLRVSYVAMGAELVLAGSVCLNPKTNNSASKNPKVNAFCVRYQKLHEDLGQYFKPAISNPFPAARSGLAYDSVSLLLAAIQEMKPQPDPDDTEALVFSLPGLALALIKTEYQGVTSTILFENSQIAEDQTMAILEFKDVYNVKSHPRCLQATGSFYGKKDNRTGCPQ